MSKKTLNRRDIFVRFVAKRPGLSRLTIARLGRLRCEHRTCLYARSVVFHLVCLARIVSRRHGQPLPCDSDDKHHKFDTDDANHNRDFGYSGKHDALSLLRRQDCENPGLF